MNQLQRDELARVLTVAMRDHNKTAVHPVVMDKIVQDVYEALPFISALEKPANTQTNAPEAMSA